MAVGRDTARDERFVKELEEVINRNCMENGSNTPDFMLAEYMFWCLRGFDKFVNMREYWYGRENVAPGGSSGDLSVNIDDPAGTVS